ncbi:uncharacterized protein BXZ73DRAFT_97408 [Epithele typhae]|uniref:uncharacterized protein n=1 Tax=Epithele typhae TaxID=378194 RepID=UPI00200840A2|nr:uncharacterized protein BXZ73DRAFT_97408 [Epithele typhae]KAH9943366.1 hypothetical protein BXZ73DRAFT_97408 [Epithele typhae]
MSFKLSAAVVLGPIASPSVVSAHQTWHVTPNLTFCIYLTDCGEFGFYGPDNFCLGGCNPLGSKPLTSYMPEPACQSANELLFEGMYVVIDPDGRRPDFPVEC